jgi:hypothetical protein
MALDPLDGYRSVHEDEGTELAAEEMLLRRHIASNAKLLRLISRSKALQEWLESEKGEGFQDQCNIALDEAMSVWLAAVDPCSTECKAAHAKARAAIAAMNMVGAVLVGAAEAANLVEVEADNEQQMTDDVESNGNG